MKYTELTLICNCDEQAEILMADLSDWPFDSFTQEPGQLKAYIPSEQYAACHKDVESYLSLRGIQFSASDVAEQNWNAVWESNFEPIPVEGRCLIRAPFHAPDPQYAYQLEIMPKMSFGTGHHATTYLMVSEILDGTWDTLRGLDMGSGTGVLAILAAKMGAAQVDAIDIDEWAYENACENALANQVAERVKPEQGNAALLPRRHYDFVLANINRNILLEDMGAYVDTLTGGGTLIVSGILERDIDVITEHGQSLGLLLENQRLREGWAALRFRKA